VIEGESFPLRSTLLNKRLSLTELGVICAMAGEWEKHLASHMILSLSKPVVKVKNGWLWAVKFPNIEVHEPRDSTVLSLYYNIIMLDNVQCIKTLFIVPTDARNYKIIGMLKRLKLRQLLRHVSVHAGTIIRELFSA